MYRSDVFIFFRIRAVSVNVPCRHIFCADCIVDKWSEHISSEGRDETLGPFLCPVCATPLLPIVDRGRRSVLNMPVHEDQTAQRLISSMIEDISNGVGR